MSETAAPKTGASVLPQPGDVLGAYRVLDQVQEGRSGVVFRVRHQAFRTNHLLKVLRRRDRAVEERLRDTVTAQAHLRHPNVVPLAGVLQANGVFGLLVDPAHGTTLRAVLQDNKGMSPDDALPLFAELLAGVHAAHRVGILHLGLSPDLVFLVTLADRVCARVSDFGVAGALQALPAPGSGGARYVAPELVEDPRKGSVQADVFSLGVLLYEMIAGVPPFWGQVRPGGVHGMPADVKPLNKVVPRLPDGLVEALEGALQYDPSARHPDCEVFARALFGDEFVLYDEADVREADQFDPRPEPTLPRSAEADPDSAPLLADVLAGRAEPRPRSRPPPEARVPGPPIIIGRTHPAEPPVRAAPSPPAPPSPPAVSAPPRPAPPRPAPQRPAPKLEAEAAPPPVPSTPVVPPSAAEAELAELDMPASAPVRYLTRFFTFVVAPVALLLLVLGGQAAYAGYRLHAARSSAELASDLVDVRTQEALGNVEVLVSLGAPAEPLEAAADKARRARTLPERAAALVTMRESQARAVQVLAPSKDPDVQLRQRTASRTIERLDVGQAEIEGALSAVAEAEALPLVSLGERLGFAEGAPFGQDMAFLSPPTE